MKKKVAIKSVGLAGALARSEVLDPDRGMAGKQAQRGAGLGEERKRIRVLVVCKSAGLREAVARALEGQSGFEVVGSVGDGEAAVRGTKAGGVDLVLMDVHMSGMGGLEATRRIKGRRGAPVVILCALDDGDHIRVAAQAAGADAFVSKAPKMFTALPAAIRRVFPGAKLK